MQVPAENAVDRTQDRMFIRNLLIDSVREKYFQNAERTNIIWNPTGLVALLRCGIELRFVEPISVIGYRTDSFHGFFLQHLRDIISSEFSRNENFREICHRIAYKNRF